MPQRGQPDRLFWWILLITAYSLVQCRQSLFIHSWIQETLMLYWRLQWDSNCLFMKYFDPLIPVFLSCSRRKRCAGLMICGFCFVLFFSKSSFWNKLGKKHEVASKWHWNNQSASLAWRHLYSSSLLFFIVMAVNKWLLWVFKKNCQ